MDGEEDVDHALRFGGGGHFPLVAGGFHLHDAGSGRDQVPFGGIDVALAIGEWVVGRRRDDAGGSGSDRSRGWRLLRKCDGNRQGEPQYTEKPEKEFPLAEMMVEWRHGRDPKTSAADYHTTLKTNLRTRMTTTATQPRRALYSRCFQ